MHYIEVENLSYAYDKQPVLEGINFTVDPGEFVILTGENGAAKSTLLRNVLGLLHPATGSSTIAKKNIHNQKMHIGYIPQQIASFNAGFPSTVMEFVRSGRYPVGRWLKKLDAHDLEHIEKSLKSVNMWDMRYKKIGELSGGQRQRVCLARMFAMDPDLLVLDEPTTGMDEDARGDFYELLQHNAHVHQKGILMVTHDHDEIKEYMDKHIRLVRKEDSEWRCFSMDSCSEH